MSRPGDESVAAMDDRDLFVHMSRQFPVRTFIFSFGLPLFALFQLVNGYVNQGSLVLIALFSLLLTGFSVKLTQYQVAVYRRRSVTE